ncbi:hypothetical protein EBZ38_09815 [bacterium]|nr:hypothetical protein [bacterium]NDD84548.1 hypothetical protein [bacterium]
MNNRARVSRAVANTAVTTWRTRTSADNQWYSVTWSPELGLFVAVAQLGTGNRVMTSPDGITWTTRASAADNNWSSVVWSPELGLFVAVAYSGTGNRVMTSPNGITWTTRASAADNQWLSVTWSPELSLFVAVANTGTGNRVMTSPNGFTWTTRASAADNNWLGVTWSPELSLFVAVANTGTGNRVMTSSNGNTWTTRASAVDNNWLGVTWSPELSLFVAVAYSGTGNRVMTSPDGITWTTRASAVDNDWYSVTWSPELRLFVAVSVNGTGNRVMTSPNGITWTTRASAADNNWYSVIWSPELSLFVAVAFSGTGNRVMTSKIALPNSKSALSVSPSYVSATEGNVVLSGALSVTGLTTPNIIRNSLGVTNYNQQNVTVQNVLATTATISNYIYSAFTASNVVSSAVSAANTLTTSYINSYGNMVNSTTNSTAVTTNVRTMVKRMRTSRANATAAVSTWTTRASAANSNWQSVTWSPELGLFVAVSNSGTYDVMTSPDGITWTTRRAGSGGWTVVVWSPELRLFVAFGNAIAITSSDGITWTTRSTPGSSAGAVWSPELSLFVSVYSGNLMTSPDGINWTIRTVPVNNQWTSVTWSPELSLFVTVGFKGTGNRVMTSPDGITWTTRASAADNNWTGVVWSPELSLFVAVAQSGTGNRVMTSPNGITWTTRAADNSWYSVPWSPELGLFVAVGGSGGLMTSLDGIKWTTRESNSLNNWSSVVWSPELGIFVAVAYTGAGDRVMTSKIALPSSKSTINVSPNYLSATEGNVVLSGTLSVTGLTAANIITNSVTNCNPLNATVQNVLATNATISNSISTTNITVSNLVSVLTLNTPPFTNYINTYGNMVNTTAKSTAVTTNVGTLLPRTRVSRAVAAGILNNTAWITRAVPANNWRSVTWSPDLSIFAAVSSSTSGNLVMTSPDGANWTTTASVVSNLWYDICWSSELRLFVAVSNSGTNNVMTSPDGTTWTTRVCSTVLYTVRWSPELGIFVATGNSIGVTSVDGITWNTRTMPSGNWGGLSWSPELSLFVAVAIGGGTYVAVSSDGITWTTRSAINALWNSIVWSSELSMFVAYGSAVAYVMRSPDAITWTTHASRSFSNGIVTYSPELGIFAAVGHQTSQGAWSKNGTTWTTFNLGTTFSYQFITWSPELSRFVVVGNNGCVISPVALPASRSTPLISQNYMSVTENNIALSGNITTGTLVVPSGMNVSGTTNTFGYAIYNPGDLLYTLRIDSTGADQVNAITTDASGNVYVGGFVNGTRGNFYATDGSTIVQTIGSLSTINNVAFVSKYNALGGLLYTSRIDSSLDDQVNALATDPSGNLIVGGYVNGSAGNFYATDGTTVLGTIGNLNGLLFSAFVAKYNSSGALLYRNRIDGAGSESVNAVATDTSGNIFVAGYVNMFSGTQANFYATNGSTIVLTMGSFSGFTSGTAFVAKYNTSGSLLFANRIDSTGDDQVLSLAMGSAGSLYVGGYTNTNATQTNFYATNGTTVLQTMGNLSTGAVGFIAKYDGSGALLYTNRIDGVGSKQVYALSTDVSGNVYAAGVYTSTQANFYATDGTTVVQTLGSFNTTGTAFISKYDSTGALLYTNKIDSTAADNALSISTDASGNVYVGGFVNYGSTQANFYATNGSTIVQTIGNISTSAVGFVAKYNGSGGLLYTMRMDSTGNDKVFAIATDALSNVYVGGYVNESATQVNFYATNGSTVLQTMGNLSTNSVAFVAKYQGNALNFGIYTTSGNVGINTTAPSSTLHVNGSLSKVSGTFDIMHPNVFNKRLLHSFIEGPRCDLIYRGTVQLHDGTATVDLDKDAVHTRDSAMTPGTFISLVDNPDVFLTNKTGFSELVYTLVGSTLTIACEDSASTNTVSWMVVGERKDLGVTQWNKTNANGYLITEYTNEN